VLVKASPMRRFGCGLLTSDDKSFMSILPGGMNSVTEKKINKKKKAKT
jgi:hypothetical protein